jgi:hypothetical protein
MSKSEQIEDIFPASRDSLLCFRRTAVRSACHRAQHGKSCRVRGAQGLKLRHSKPAEIQPSGACRSRHRCRHLPRTGFDAPTAVHADHALPVLKGQGADRLKSPSWQPSGRRADTDHSRPRRDRRVLDRHGLSPSLLFQRYLAAAVGHPLNPVQGRIARVTFWP